MSTLPRIRHVRAFVRDSTVDGGADCHDVADSHWIDGFPTPIANPMSCHPAYAASRKSWGINALGTMVVEVECEDGTTGVGVTIAGEAGCHIVERHLSRFVEGEDPSNVEKMWDRMYRATINYGRKGLALQSISAVDLALWDLLGHLRRLPVFRLLGGRCRDAVPLYCTTCRPDLAKTWGFAGAKVACPYGPSGGDVGLRRNVDFFAEWRRAVGGEFPLMLDCYMSLNRSYSLRLAESLRPHGLRWLEEPLQPDDYEGLATVARGLAGHSLLASGEHEYTRFGFRRLVDSVDLLQPDVTWAGGLTETRRVVALAAAHDLPVVPHGSSVYAYHLQTAFTNCPLGEFINLSERGDSLVPYFGDLFTDEPLPVDGRITLPEDRPGFGVTLNRRGLRRPVTHSPCDAQPEEPHSDSLIPF